MIAHDQLAISGTSVEKDAIGGIIKITMAKETAIGIKDEYNSIGMGRVIIQKRKRLSHQKRAKPK